MNEIISFGVFKFTPLAPMAFWLSKYTVNKTISESSVNYLNN